MKKDELMGLVALLAMMRDKTYNIYERSTGDAVVANVFLRVANAATAGLVELKKHIEEAPAELPRAYLIHGINGRHEHYVHAVKLVEGNKYWATDDGGLGEFWSGNEALL